MSTIGIVAEYNPFHNGHLYQLNEAKKITGAQNSVVIMSGNFLQRGIPAVMNKYTRAALAVQSGVDLVLELPFVYATSSARDFALASVSMLSKLGIADYIAFGAECDNLEILRKISDIVYREPETVSNDIKQMVSDGISYPAARASAISKIIPEALSVLNEPNNILAIEYLCALRKTGAKLTPVLIKRVGTGYLSEITDGCFASASAIRKLLLSETLQDASDCINALKQNLPENVYYYISSRINKSLPVSEEDLTPFLQYRLLMEDNALPYTADMTTELFNKLKKINVCNDYESVLNTLKSKDITMTRINRAVIHYLIGLSAKDMELFKENGIVTYGRILALRKQSSFLLKEIKNCSGLQIITKSADAAKQLNPISMKMSDYDMKASELYNCLVYNKFKATLPNDYQIKLPVL